MASTARANKDRFFLKYSQTPPYCLLVITATFSAPGENRHTFSCKKKKTLVNTATQLLRPNFLALR